jgi:hypothetical protein
LAFETLQIALSQSDQLRGRFEFDWSKPANGLMIEAMRTEMLRKSILLFIAVTGAALASATDGYAFGGGGHSGRVGHGRNYAEYGHGYPYGYGGHGYPYASSSYYSEDDEGCYLRVMSPYGWRIRHAKVCN